MTTARISAGKVWRRAFALATFCGATGALAEPTDGFYWPSAWWHNLSTFQSQTRYWEGNIVPADGGVAYWTGTQAGDISFGSAVALRGLDFGKVQLVSASGAERPRILSAGLTLTGDDAFISGTGWGSNASGRELEHARHQGAGFPDCKLAVRELRHHRGRRRRRHHHCHERQALRNGRRYGPARRHPPLGAVPCGGGVRLGLAWGRHLRQGTFCAEMVEGQRCLRNARRLRL